MSAACTEDFGDGSGWWLDASGYREWDKTGNTTRTLTRAQVLTATGLPDELSNVKAVLAQIDAANADAVDVTRQDKAQTLIASALAALPAGPTKDAIAAIAVVTSDIDTPADANAVIDANP